MTTLGVEGGGVFRKIFESPSECSDGTGDGYKGGEESGEIKGVAAEGGRESVSVTQLSHGVKGGALKILSET